MSTLYVYGVVSEPDTGPDLTAYPVVGDDPQVRVGWVRSAGLAAAVSPLTIDRPLGTPADLRAHAAVLDGLAENGVPVLPFRFGTVLDDEPTVAEGVLADGHDAFTTALDRLRGRTQFTVRARYERDAVLREVLDERPDIVELRERVAGLSEVAGRSELVRLGELVAQALDGKRKADAARLRERLAPAADAVVALEPADEDAIADFSFLVPDSGRPAFEQAAEQMAAEWRGRARLRLLGPLAPYDFVVEAMTEAPSPDTPARAGGSGSGRPRARE